MQYFIPAWYSKESWMENERPWYIPRSSSECDDTVKQVQLFFHYHVAPFEIVLLSYSPNFRHFLHRQNVYHASWWSCFDAMQCIRSKSMSTFSFRDLAWPNGVEFVYSPFAILAMLDGKKFAQIDFAEDGNMFLIDMFSGDQCVSRNIYDDRGFLSSHILYENGVAVCQRYFDESGIWKFAEYASDGHVVINPNSAWYLGGMGESAKKVSYLRPRYDCMDDVVAEVLGDFVADQSTEDIFIIAMHSRHSMVLSRILANRVTILSFFESRVQKNGITTAGQKLLDSCACVIADNDATSQIVRNLARSPIAPVRVITPYETKMEIGEGQHLRVQSILVAVDSLDAAQFDEVMSSLAVYVCARNHLARVCLLTRSSRYNEREKLLKRVQAALTKAGLNPEMAGQEDPSDHGSRVDGELGIVFSVSQCMDELQIKHTIRGQRVVVDLSNRPDQLLQVSAISTGIPQITMLETEYIVDGYNGRVLHDIGQLSEAVDFYLSSVEHNNEAQIASYNLGARYSAPELAKAWKEVIEFGQHSIAAARKH